MHSQYFAVDEGSESQVIEHLGAISPNVDRAVLSNTFIIEAIGLCDLSTFVVSSDQSDSVWVFDLGNGYFLIA